MFNQIKAVTGPAIFTKGVLRYKQGRFEEARRLIVKAGRRMEALKADPLYTAALLLIEAELGWAADRASYQAALAALADSPHSGTGDYGVIVAALGRILSGHS
jgi:Tfp pilus assembly protein PilF